MAKEFEQNIVSKRFLEVFDELQQSGQVNNVKEFCKRLDYAPQSMSQIKAGKRDITIEIIIKIFHEFNGNPVYILFGYGSKLVEPNSIPVMPHATTIRNSGNIEDSKLVQKLEDLVEAKNEFIESLKREIERLNSELKKRGD
ncbi:MAG TPA: hypothetical protein VIM65_19830 [Cyclobacteriaceae bacterium]